MPKPSFAVSVVMQRRLLQSRWADAAWEAWGVLPAAADAGAPRQLLEQGGIVQWLHPGLALELHRDEAEGYYLNVASDSPRVFVRWRMEGEREGADAARGVPLQVTVSYNEASRWMDGGHSVDSVAMPPDIYAWVGEFVEANYRPEPRKRVKPRSFMHPKDRVG